MREGRGGEEVCGGGGGGGGGGWGGVWGRGGGEGGGGGGGEGRRLDSNVIVWQSVNVNDR